MLDAWKAKLCLLGSGSFLRPGKTINARNTKISAPLPFVRRVNSHVNHPMPILPAISDFNFGLSCRVARFRARKFNGVPPFKNTATFKNSTPQKTAALVPGDKYAFTDSRSRV